MVKDIIFKSPKGLFDKAKYIRSLLNWIFIFFENSRNWKILGFLIVCVLSLPVFSLREGTIPGDSFTYIELGRSIVTDRHYIASPESPLFQTSYGRSPLFPILISISFQIFGISTWSALFVAKLAFLGNMLFIYLLVWRLFNIKTGLIVASLVATSSYMMGFAAQIEIDQVMTFFAFAGLYFMVLALNNNRLGVAIIAGIGLGLSFLTKEIAVILMPIPLYLYLSIPEWKSRKNLLPLIGYIVGIMSTLSIWWIYFYNVTGDIFLLSSRKSIASLFSQVNINFIVWGSLLLIVVVYTVHSLRKNRVFLFTVSNKKNYLVHKAISNLVVLLSPWLLWILFTAFFSIALSRLATWFTSIGEIPQRLAGFKYWMDIYLLSTQPILQWLFPSILLIILSSILWKQHGHTVLIWLLLSFTPQILTLAYRGQYVQPARYGMWLFWLGYIFLGCAIGLLLKIIGKALRLSNRQNQVFIAMVIIPIVLFGIFSGRRIPITYNYNQYQSPSFYNAEPIKSISRWINLNIPKHASLASSMHFLTAYNFYTGGTYNIHRWYALRNDLSERIWPFNPEIELTLDQDHLVFQDRIRKYQLADVSYLQLSTETLVAQNNQSSRIYYSAISRYELNRYLLDLEIDYLVLSQFPGHAYMLNVMPGIFEDDPAYTIEHTVSWKEAGGVFKIIVIKVDRALLNNLDYPVTVTNNVWPLLIKNGQSLLGENFDLKWILQSTGNNPIIFRPINDSNTKYYIDVAEAFINQGKFALAAYEYHLALLDHPHYANDLSEVFAKLVADRPNDPGTWLLLGDLDYLNEDYESAKEKYERALQIANGSNYINSAVHIALGKVYSRLGSSIDSIFHFEEGLSVSAFQGRQIREELLIQKANLAQKEGQILSSINLYNSVLNPNTISYMSSNKPRTYFDFIAKFDRAQIDSDREGMVYPAVFIYDNNPLKVLFAHPRSRITYHLDLIDNTSLVFTPLLDPSVWAFGRGDGVNFQVNLKDEMGKVYLLYSEYFDPKNLTADRHLIEEKIDLSKWSGQNVEIAFITTAGPNGNDKYDWAAWGEVRLVQPYLYNFLSNFHHADLNIFDYGAIDIVQQTINNEERWTLFQHPSSSLTFSLQLPYNSFIYFGVGLDPAIWDPSNGDGVEYLIFLNTKDNPNRKYQIYYRYVDPKNKPEDRYWLDEKIDLSKFGGKPVDITFTVLPGPDDDYNFDWGGWSMPVLVTEKLQN